MTLADADTVEWVEMARHPLDDEITLTYVDSGYDLHADVWTGSAWDGSQTLRNGNVTPTYKCFDVEYEGLGGNCMVVFGQDNNSGTQYCRKDSGTTAFEAQVEYGSGVEKIQHMDLGYDPAGYGMVMATRSNGSDLECALWDGATETWSEGREVDTSLDIPSDTDMPISSAMVNGSPFIIYDDSGENGYLNWCKLNSSPDFSVQDDVFISGMGDLVSSTIESYPGGDKVLILLSDDLNQLWLLSYNGSAFTLLNNGLPIDLSCSSTTAMPFAISIKGTP